MAKKPDNLHFTGLTSFCLIWPSTPSPESQRRLTLANSQSKGKFCLGKQYKISIYSVYKCSFTRHRPYIIMPFPCAGSESEAETSTISERRRCLYGAEFIFRHLIDNCIGKLAHKRRLQHFLAVEHTKQERKEVAQRHISDCFTSRFFSSVKKNGMTKEFKGSANDSSTIQPCSLSILHCKEERRTHTLLVQVHSMQQGFFAALSTLSIKVAKRCLGSYDHRTSAKELDIEAIKEPLGGGAGCKWKPGAE